VFEDPTVLLEMAFLLAEEAFMGFFPFVVT
jgi:hypothetical protein